MCSRYPRGVPFALLLALLSLGGCEQVTITVVEVTQVEVHPAQGELAVGEALHLNVVLRDQSGSLLQGRPVGWSTGDPSVAQVSADGVVLAEAPGLVPIKASVAGVEGTANIRVLSPARIGVPSQLFFVGRVGEPNPPAQLLPITNSGELPLSELSLAMVPLGGGPVDWLSADLQQSAGGMVALLTAELAGLPAGSYAARLRIFSSKAENSPVDVDVELSLQEPASSIQLSATTLGFPWRAGQAPPPPVTVDVWNGGAGFLAELELSIRYGAGQPSGWLNARLAAPSAPTEMEIAATPGTLPVGTYSAGIFLSSPGAINSPRELQVRLTVSDPVSTEDDPDDHGADDPGDDDSDDTDSPVGDATTASVREISYATTGGADSTRHLRGVLSVIDELGDPLRSASVAIELTNADTEETWHYSEVSDARGEMTFSLNNHPDGCYVTRVVTLSATGHTWDDETPSNGICRSSRDP